MRFAIGTILEILFNNKNGHCTGVDPRQWPFEILRPSGGVRYSDPDGNDDDYGNDDGERGHTKEGRDRRR
jgi:hypothetical protein